MSDSTLTSYLDANLAALGDRHAPLAARLRATAPAPLEFEATDDGAFTALLDGAPLASRRAPLDEAARLAARVDVVEHAAIAVIGFGVGHHVAQLARTVQRSGLVIVFEPDLALLRAVFERIDCRPWLTDAHVVFIVDPDDRGEMARVLEGAEGILGQGTTILEHPASRRRLGELGPRFAQAFAEFMTTAKTTLLTTLVRSIDTVRNYLDNARQYVGGHGIEELAGCAAGHPAIVVSAGPSLHRNIDLLRDPAVRERCVIIAAQTTLQPLLDVGVRPHFVVALDFHEISRRFYERLTPDAVAGVTLVIDPKAHPAIPRAFPGPVRCCTSPLLDRMLGDLRRPMGDLEPGATVAHLAVYLARHLGCNPIMLTGQDLAFPDGLYYAPGTSIHDVWSPELNPFNTIAMMEWQRIVRHRRHLHSVADVNGRSIYTDTQMLIYLQHFERDFERFGRAGTTVIDATEGGARISHTTPMTLRAALDAHATRPLPELPALTTELDPERLDAAVERFRTVRREIEIVRDLSRRTADLLDALLHRPGNEKTTRARYDKIDRARREVERHYHAFELIGALNQLGSFKRLRADRVLHFAKDLDQPARERAQLERDLVNVRWIDEAGTEMLARVDDAIATMRGRPPRDRASGVLAHATGDRVSTASIGIMLAVHPDDAERLAAPLADGRSLLAHTVARVHGVIAGAPIVLVADHAWTPPADTPDDVVIHRTDGTPFGPEWRAIDLAFQANPHGWRGAPGGLTAWDRAVAPDAMAAAMDAHALDGAIVVGATWAFVDVDDASGIPALVRRFRERPDQHALVFTQAPPGLGACLVSRDLMHRLTERTRISTLGGPLAYLPADPHSDPISGDSNVQIDAALRHAMVCAIPERAEVLETFSALDPAADARTVVTALDAAHARARRAAPREVRIDCTTRRAAIGVFRRSLGPELPPCDLDPARLADVSFAPDTTVSFAGSGDPLLHPAFDELIAAVRRAGAARIHVRTELPTDDAVARLRAAEVAYISIDLHADTAITSALMLGEDRFRATLERLHELIASRTMLAGPASTAGIGVPWIVPRLQRRLETIDDLEPFFDRWQHLLGTAVIEAPPVPDDLAPAVTPARVIRHTIRERLTILADGTCPADERDLTGTTTAATLDAPSFSDVWRAVRAARDAADDGVHGVLLP